MRAENTTRPGGPQAGERGGIRSLLLTAFLLALTVRVVTALSGGAAQPQEIRYVTIAQGILSGEGFNGLDRRFPDIIQPPLYPMILTIVQSLPGPDLMIARLLSCLLGAVLVFPVAAITRRLFGGTAAVRSAFLVAFYPLLTRMSASAITEALFAALIASAALLVWKARDEARASAVHAVNRFLPAGLLFGLAFLTRPEALAYLGMASLLLFVPIRLDRKMAAIALRGTGLLIAGFVLLVLPYTIWIHGKTGRWMLSPKAAHVQVNHGLVQTGQLEHWKETYGSNLFFEHVKFGLNDDDTAIRSQEIFAKHQPADGNKASFFRPTMAVSMLLKNLEELYLETIKHGYVIPSILLVMGGVGVFSRPWSGVFRYEAIFVTGFAAAGFTFLLSHVEPRFLYTVIPFIVPWMAEGWARAEDWILKSLGQSGQSPAGRLLVGGLGVAVVILAFVHVVPAQREARSLWEQQRNMGLWVRENLGEGRTLMAATPVVSFYAGAEFEVLPYAELERVLRYARHKGVDYLVAERDTVERFRPQLTSLLNPSRRHEELDLTHSLAERSDHAIYLYRISDPHETARQ